MMMMMVMMLDGCLGCCWVSLDIWGESMLILIMTKLMMLDGLNCLDRCWVPRDFWGEFQMPMMMMLMILMVSGLAWAVVGFLWIFGVSRC